jgi:hypothetical protein
VTPIVRFGEIRFKCQGGYPTEMIVTVETVTPQQDGSEHTESVPVVFPFDEFKLWPEFPATYARISGEGWKRFDEEQAARAAATVATSVSELTTSESTLLVSSQNAEPAVTSPTLWQRVSSIFS